MTSSPAPEKPFSLVSGIATLIWRIFLLGVGGGIAFGGGLLWAMQNPQEINQEPFVIKLWQTWQTSTNPSSSAATTAATPASDLENLTAQIQQLQAQVDQPGEESEAIQARLDTLEEQLADMTASADLGSTLPTDKLKVTLPSDFLFSPRDSTLNSEAKQVLNEFLVKDLQSYVGDTILIAAYTDVEDDLQINRELSFRRAKAIENYLSEGLEGNYRWVATGYGKDSSQDNETSLLNRRVEIAVN